MADVVSTGEAFSSTDAQREFWPLTAEVAVGTALINGGRAGVAYTPSGGHTSTETIAGMTISGIADGGVGLDALEVSVATDGTYEFPVTGAGPSTANGTMVYAVVSGGKITGLTLTASTNTPWGVVNNPQDYVAASGVACVKIGATNNIAAGS
jgi:hypothetical protein